MRIFITSTGHGLNTMQATLTPMVSSLKKSFNRLQLFTLKQDQYQVPLF